MGKKRNKRNFTRPPRRNGSSLASSPTEGQSIPSYSLNSVKSEEDLLRPKEDGKQYKLTIQTVLGEVAYQGHAIYDSVDITL